MLFVGVLSRSPAVMLSFRLGGTKASSRSSSRAWREIATDPYYAEMFLRTFRIALLTTLITAMFGAPEAYILNRMSGRWKSFFLLVILGPLLISVVARTLGWALLFGGNNGLVNKLLMSLGLIGSPLPFMFTETGVVIALAHVMMPFMVLSVWRASVDPQIENAPCRSAFTHDHPPSSCLRSYRACWARSSFSRYHSLYAACHRRWPPAQVAALAYDVPTPNWPLSGARSCC
jgi:putative spermidine/putrescine transport system permease protein